MAEIYDLFVPEDAEKIRNIMIETGRTELCWYPSSGVDYQAINEMDRFSMTIGENQANREMPHNTPSDRSNLFYVFSDMWWANKHLSDEISEWSAPTETHEFIEVKLKDPIPGSAWSPAVVLFAADEHAGRAFLLKYEKPDGTGFVPVLIFSVENLTFLVHTLMASRIRVKALYHKRDGGGSFGGSYEPMFFIYPALEFLGVEFLISEYFRNDGNGYDYFTTMLLYEIEHLATIDSRNRDILEELIMYGHDPFFQKFRGIIYESHPEKWERRERELEWSRRLRSALFDDNNQDHRERHHHYDEPYRRWERRDENFETYRSDQWIEIPGNHPSGWVRRYPLKGRPPFWIQTWEERAKMWEDGTCDEWRRQFDEAVGRMQARVAADSSPTGQLQLRFWHALIGHLREKAPHIRLPKPQPKHWISASIGRSGFHLSVTAKVKHDSLGVELYISGPGAKDRFATLLPKRERVEKELGFELDWQELPDSIACRIITLLPKTPLENEQRWTKYFEWITDRLVKMDKVFRPLIKEL